MILKFGKFKGREIADVAKDNEGAGYLNWLRENTDTSDPKYGATNKAIVDEINKVLDGKTIYVKEKKGKFSKGNSGSVDLSGVKEKLDTIIKNLNAIKENLGVLELDKEVPF